MKKRGRIVRDATSGTGLLMVEGRQYPFFPGEVWISDSPPKPGLVVDVDLDEDGRVRSVAVVRGEQLAQEQATVSAIPLQRKGVALASAGALNSSWPALIGVVTLVVAWWFLVAVSIQTPFLGTLDVTFWELLGFVDARSAPDLLDQPGSLRPGIFGVMAVFAVLGPLLPLGWRDKRAALGGLLPLVLMVVVAFGVRGSIGNRVPGGATGVPSTHAAGQAQEETRQTASLGLGGYLALAVSLYFALASAKCLLISSAGKKQELPASHRKVA